MQTIRRGFVEAAQRVAHDQVFAARLEPRGAVVDGDPLVVELLVLRHPLNAFGLAAIGHQGRWWREARSVGGDAGDALAQ